MTNRSLLFKLFDYFHDALVGASDDSQHGHCQDEDVLDVRPDAQSLGHLGLDHKVDQHRNHESQTGGAQSSNERYK